MKKILLTILLIFLSTKANAFNLKVTEENCYLLNQDIEFNLANYYLNLKKIKKETSQIDRNKIKKNAKKYLDLASKQSNVFIAICKE